MSDWCGWYGPWDKNDDEKGVVRLSSVILQDILEHMAYAYIMGYMDDFRRILTYDKASDKTRMRITINLNYQDKTYTINLEILNPKDYTKYPEYFVYGNAPKVTRKVASDTRMLYTRELFFTDEMKHVLEYRKTVLELEKKENEERRKRSEELRKLYSPEYFLDIMKKLTDVIQELKDELKKKG